MSSVPLTQAVTSGDARAVSAVLANGADVNERTGGGQTALILAIIFGHTHLIPLLLAAGADPQLRDNLGLNATDWAQRRGATEAIGVLSGEAAKSSPTIFKTSEPPRPARPAAPPNAQREKPKSVSEEERSRRWLEGLKQRIAEQSQSEVADGPNIFRPQSQAAQRLESPPRPEIPSEPGPQPEIPAQPEPQPEIPSPSPDPQPDIPSHPPEPEIPSPPKPELPRLPTPEIPSPSTPEIPSPFTPEIQSRPSTLDISSRRRERRIEPQVETSAITTEKPVVETEAESPRSWSNRKRCPQCNAVYNGELVSYCVYHSVALVDIDAPPVVAEPPKGSPVLFWVIVAITLTASIVLASMATKYFYNATQAQQTPASAPAPAPVPMQKGTPTLGQELEGKAVSLPIAEAPLKGQEAIPGTVVVRVVIDRTGRVKEAQPSGGDWLLRGAASEAAMKSTFAPEKLRSRQTVGTITYTYGP